MCDDSSPGIRDGITTDTIPNPPGPDALDYGQHETYEYYQRCVTRSRNKGLFLADQFANVNTATQRLTADYTRQNANGNANDNNRHGYECPEER